MKAIGIITDSHSSIDQKKAEELGIMVLPMPFSIGGKCYYEGVTLSREEFFQKLDSGEDITTSQPSPEEVMELWDRALKEYETVLYLPISSGLSGSCETAEILAREEAYENRVFVVDNGRVSTPMHRAVLDALELIEDPSITSIRSSYMYRTSSLLREGRRSARSDRYKRFNSSFACIPSRVK